MENEEIYEPDLLSVTDEDGNEIVFELLERYETDDDVYVAITEYHDTAEEIVDADYEVIILKVVEDENGDEFLEEIQDEMGYEKYDVVVANIIADVIIAMAPIVKKAIKKDGTFISSGIILLISSSILVVFSPLETNLSK